MPEILPTPIRTKVQERFGSSTKVESLSGLTDARVWRVWCANQTVIIKQTSEENEVFFYEKIRSTLQEYEIPTPCLYFIERESTSAWLVIEDIPKPFPRDRWLADSEQLEYLKRLHKVNKDEWRTASSVYRPKWTSEMTENALRWFPSTIADELKPILRSWCDATQSIFEPLCLISGDPNPMNWGCRADDTLVHFDWERVGWGTPAIDLAITVPRLGQMSDFSRVAAIYLQKSEPREVEELATQIKLAKGWVMVELLSKFWIEIHGERVTDLVGEQSSISMQHPLTRASLSRPNGDKYEHIISYIQKEFPAWLRQFQHF